ncbi:MAG: hypothetical protein K0B52_02945 [FCB group bacterium]|nr:hypothetical protein [FCB group bacterium]
MKTIYSTFILTLLLLFAGCDYVEEVIIHHEPHLNIYANVSAAEYERNFVHVFRTTGFGEPDRYEIDSIIYHEFYNPSSGDTITYQTLYIDTSFAVNGAKVYFLDGPDTIRFYEKAQGIYFPEDTAMQIIVGREYDLYVETPEFGVATATETALNPISWNHSVNDTILISLSNPVDSIFWSNIGGAYKIIFEHLVRYFFEYVYEYIYVIEERDLRDPFWAYDSSDYDFLFNPDPFKNILYSEYWDIDTLELYIRVIAYSESYLDYTSLQNMQFTTGFIRYPTINDFRVNIANALGAFTSMSFSDQRIVRFVR